MFNYVSSLFYFSLSLSAIAVAIVCANSTVSIYIVGSTALASFSRTGYCGFPFHARLGMLKFSIIVLDVELPCPLSAPRARPSLLSFLMEASDRDLFRGISSLLFTCSTPSTIPILSTWAPRPLPQPLGLPLGLP